MFVASASFSAFSSSLFSLAYSSAFFVSSIGPGTMSLVPISALLCFSVTPVGCLWRLIGSVYSFFVLRGSSAGFLFSSLLMGSFGFLVLSLGPSSWPFLVPRFSISVWKSFGGSMWLSASTSETFGSLGFSSLGLRGPSFGVTSA